MNMKEAREAVGQFVDQYNQKWLLAKLGYKSPQEARENYNKLRGAA